MPSVFVLLLRAVVATLALVATAGQVTYVTALASRPLASASSIVGSGRPALVALITAHALVSVASGILAIIFAFRPIRREPTSGVLAVALASWSYLLAYPGIVLLLRPDPGAVRTLFEGHFLLVEVAGLAGLIRFSAAFPRPLATADFTDPEDLPLWARPFQGLRHWMLGPVAPWLAGAAVLGVVFWMTSMTGQSLGDAGLNPLMDVVRFAAAGVVVVNLRSSWVSGTREARNRLTWLAVGLSLLLGTIAVLIGGNVLLAVTDWREPAIAWRPILLDLGVIGFLASFAAAALRSGATDPMPVARRIVSFSALALLGLFLAAGLEAFLSTAVVGRIALPRGLGTVLALVAVGSTYRPMLRFMERIMDQVVEPPHSEG